jgi:hypothetical protein
MYDNAEALKERSARWKTAGVCSRCGRVECEPDRICDKCRAYARAGGAARAQKRISEGLCVKCGIEASMPGRQRCKCCTARDQDKAYKKRYGISAEEVDEILFEQSGRCKLCTDTLDERFVVDHCHDSLQVRGILCPECNIKLGHFEALVGRMGIAAIQQYLARPLVWQNN